MSLFLHGFKLHSTHDYSNFVHLVIDLARLLIDLVRRARIQCEWLWIGLMGRSDRGRAQYVLAPHPASFDAPREYCYFGPFYFRGERNRVEGRSEYAFGLRDHRLVSGDFRRNHSCHRASDYVWNFRWQLIAKAINDTRAKR